MKGAFAQAIDNARSSLAGRGDFGDFVTAIEDAFLGHVAEISSIVPSTETIMRLIQQALGFDLPSLDQSLAADLLMGVLAKVDALVNAVIDNATLRGLVGQAAGLLDTAQDTVLTALSTFQSAINGVSGIQPILDKIDALQAFFDGTQTPDVDVQVIINSLNAIANGDQDIFGL